MSRVSTLNRRHSLAPGIGISAGKQLHECDLLPLAEDHPFAESFLQLAANGAEVIDRFLHGSAVDLEGHVLVLFQSLREMSRVAGADAGCVGRPCAQCPTVCSALVPWEAISATSDATIPASIPMASSAERSQCEPVRLAMACVQWTTDSANTPAATEPQTAAKRFAARMVRRAGPRAFWGRAVRRPCLPPVSPRFRRSSAAGQTHLTIAGASSVPFVSPRTVLKRKRWQALDLRLC
jgi:hypothetical protein